VSLSLFWLISSNAPAVDTVRLSLESSSEEWFSWVRYAGYAVAIGCAMEAPETFVIIKRWWLLRFRDDEREETKEDKRGWIVPLAALGLLIIVVGIVVETYAEDRVSYFDGLLRTHESDKITVAENEAAEATRQAGGAAASATTAHSESDAATTASGNALNIASGARREADSFEKDIVSAKTLAAGAESHLADALKEAADARAELYLLKTPRTLKNPELLANAIRLYPGTQYTFSSVAGDGESINLLMQIDKALQSAGWKRTVQSPKPIIGFPLDSLEKGFMVAIGTQAGLGIAVDSEGGADALNSKPRQDWPAIITTAGVLRDWLEHSVAPSTDGNVQKSVTVPSGNSPVIRIAVGSKPIVNAIR
jgi:hypothetical protein